MTPHVVVMFEPAKPGETLKLTEQVNEVFGVFNSGDEAEQWTNRMADAIKDRQWLIIPLSDPRVVLRVDTVSN